MKVLNDNDKIKVNYKGKSMKGHVGTIHAGYKKDVEASKKYGWEPLNTCLEDYIERDKQNGGMKFWGNQEPCCLCGDPGHYDREEKKWADAVQIEDGEEVMIEGEVVIVMVTGDHSDFIHFKEGV